MVALGGDEIVAVVGSITREKEGEEVREY